MGKVTKTTPEIDQALRNVLDNEPKENVAWEDLRFPATGINPPGGASDADVDNADTPWIGTLLYAANATELACGIAQMPHSWKEGSNIKPHIHWAPTNNNAGDVLWQFDYMISNVNGIFPGAYTTLQKLASADGDLNKHQIIGFDEIDMTGYVLSCVILWRVSRIGGDASDNYEADARLIEFDIHFQVDGDGSRQEYIK